MPKKYYISFDGYVTIEANSIERAEEKFWKGLTCITKEHKIIITLNIFHCFTFL